MPSDSFSNFFTNLFSSESEQPRPIRRGGTQPSRTTQNKQKVPVQTKREALQETARQATGKSGGRFRAFGSGINRWAIPFEAVNRAVAAGADLVGYGPSDTIGWNRNNYLQNLEAIRRSQAADYEAHPGYYTAGAVAGLPVGGAGLSLGVRGAGSMASKLPGVAGKVGKAIEASQILRAGEKGRNLAKLAASGAAFGGAEEAVRGGSTRDIATSATVGAVAAPAAGKLVELGGFLFRPAADLLRRQDASGRLLRRFTSATTGEMRAARAAYKAANNGAEPTLFEILPENDVPRIRALLSRMSPNVQQEAAGAIQARARNVQPEMNVNIDEATRAARGRVARGFASDLTASRGGPLPADVPMASEAATSKVGVERLRSAEAGNIMAPYDNRVVAQSIEEMLPQVPVNRGGTITYQIDADPETVRVLRHAAGSLRLTEEGINISDTTRIIRKLQSRVRANGTDADAAQTAINHLEDFLQANHPDAAEAMVRMNTQFAGKSRVGEGIDEGMASRPSSEAAQKLDQYAYGKAYETPEGAQGRMIGQTHALRQSVSGTPEDAMRAVGALAEDTNLQRAVGENISPRAAARLAEGAQAQSEGLRRLASLDKNLKDSIPDSDISVLGNALLTFNPASFPITRIVSGGRFLQYLRKLNLPDKADRLLIESLFSQDSHRISAALSRLNNAGRDGRRSIIELAGALSAAGVAGPYAAEPQSYEPGRVSVDQSMQGPVENAPWANDPVVDQNPNEPWANDPEVNYGADTSFGEEAIKSVFPNAQITDTMRDPNSTLGRANEGSYHVRTNGAVDVRPIPGMTFEQFVRRLRDAGYDIAEAIDEVKHPSKHATGPHWHVAFR